ncbi:MAG: OmpH family outer membrane protein [Acidobacteria bacterium]|nr:OmpH family outer membrane protein [Acidobacteriota bacterium]
MRLAVLAGGAVWMAGAGWAQSKVAIINLQRAVLETAEIKKASNELEAKFKPRQQQMEKLQKDLQTIQQQLTTMAGKLTPQAEAELNQQGQRKQRDLQRLSEDLQADVDRERNDILSKATQRMQEVVKKMAEEKGYDVVVDVSNTIYFKPALEITTESIAAYDKAHPVK